jgi:hypothetical protein
MNSNHQTRSAEPQQNYEWLSRAKHIFFGAVIHGSGRYCVAVMNRIDIFLYETHEEAAMHLSQDSKYRFYDLATCAEPRVQKTARTIGDAYDPEELRRERREKRAAMAQGTSVA